MTLIGAPGGRADLAEEVAAGSGTINYEITCGLLAAGARGSRSRERPLTQALRGRPAWIVGGDRARRAARPRRHGHRPGGGGRPRGGRPRAGQCGARAGVPAVRGVRRLAGDRPRARAASTTSRRSRARRSRRTSRGATSPSTRWRRPLGRRRADRPARRPPPTSTPGACALVGAGGLREPTRCGRCAWPASPPSSASRADAGDRAPDAGGRAAACRAPPASASSPSCAG